ncbi:hypothetical protein ACQY0O_008066 [Thecaphora frezii]
MSTQPTSTRSLYRSLLRLVGPKTPLCTTIRTLLLSPCTRTPLPFSGHATPTTTLQNLHTYLFHKARHASLLELYNPTASLTEQERVRLTARRVGLDVPLTPQAALQQDGDRILSSNESAYRKGAQLASSETDKERKRRKDLYSGKGDGLNKGGPLAPPGFKSD